MAVNQDVIGLKAGIADKALARAREKRFYLLVGLLFLGLVVVGFSKNYYFRPFFPEMGPMYSDLVRFHGVVMTAWVFLFATQTFLVSRKKVKLHMKLGWAGVGLAVLVLVTGYMVSIAAARRMHGTETDIGGIPPLEFMIVPLGDLVMFVILFGGAIYLRKRPADHKRLMLLTAANFLPPAAARMPVDELQALGAYWLFGLPTTLIAAALVYDTWRNRRLNTLFLGGAILLIVSFPLRLAIAGTETWERFATWLIS